jgi:tyrosyl-tRNA synthetase
MLPAKEQLEILKRGCAEIIVEEEFVKKLERSIATGKPLKAKLGLDPTAPDIHLGHTVVLRKLRQFQDLGHEVILLIGDYTALIGDPTGKSETRKPLSREDIIKNAQTYQEQIFKILDPQKTRVTFNSQWLSKLNFEEIIQLASKYNVARMLEREDFNKRFKEGRSISIHEFFYPLMQGYDSVFLEADVELGATEQKFNILMGRHLQKEYDKESQIALLMPILVGLDGVKKMSKSLGNYIGIDEHPNEIYGKTMSIADEIMIDYFVLVSTLSNEEINKIKIGLEKGELHPRDVKMMLAKELVTNFHGEEAAKEAEENFMNIFQKGNIPEDIEEFSISDKDLDNGEIWLPKLLTIMKLVPSTSEGKRQIAQGAVKLNGEKVNSDINIKPTTGTIVQVGKRKFGKIN